MPFAPRWRQIHDRLDAVPGIKASSLSAGAVPLQSNSELPFWLEGQPKPSSHSGDEDGASFTSSSRTICKS